MKSPGLIISRPDTKPEPKAMVLGGVLIGKIIEHEHMAAAARIREICWPLVIEDKNSSGKTKLAVAVLLIRLLITKQTRSAPNVSKTSP